MVKPKTENRTWTAGQVVAHNMARAREIRGLTQSEVAERLSKFTDSRWSQATVAQAEGSVSGQRVRQFTANELVALARCFDVPVLYFFLPPADGEGAFESPDAGPQGWPWEYLLMLVWGHRNNFPTVADRAAPWAHASAVLTVPASDILDGAPDPALLGHLTRDRERYTPHDMLAVAFNGLARRGMRGSQPGEVQTLVAGLRGLATALEAFNNYRPGTFLALDEILTAMPPGDREGETS